MTALDFDFKLPLKRDDLRSSESPNQYVVSEVYSLKDLKAKIEECKLCAKENGCDFILEHFSTLFSVLQHFNSLDFKVLRSFYEEVIIKELEQLFNNLSIVMADDDLPSELRLKMLNVTKMILYSGIEYLKSFQEKIDKTYSLVINEKRNKNTKMMKLKEEHNWDWEENERKMLMIINKIIKLPLQRLWDPPMPEEEFVSMIADCCYNILEKPSITSVKMKPTKDVILEILAVLIKQYNNAISCKVKIVQLLKLYEHLVVILAQAVVLFVEKYNCRSLIKELILEIIETEGEVDNYVQDGSSSRAFSNFIVEIAKLQPALILPCINLLIDNLSRDPYSMRICVLTVMAEIITNALHNDGESLTEESRKMRDNFLDHILDHVIDINVFVRSRALRLWHAIYKQKAIPTSYIIPLLEQAMGRLHDKSSNVVKNAIQLTTIMLEDNLYGAMLDAETVKQNLRAVKLKLLDDERAKGQPSVFKIWFYSRIDVSDFIAKQLKDDKEKSVNTTVHSEKDDSDEEEISSKKSADDFSENIIKLQKYIIDGNFANVFDILVRFEAENIRKLKLVKYANDKVQYYEWILANLCKSETNVREEIINRFAECEDIEDVRAILNEPVQVEDQEDQEFGKDKGVLTYCEDFLRFVQTMSKATLIISEIMMGKSTVEVMEAVEFFKVAHQFSLSGADEGVRNMLLLINSKELGFKEAVKNTFKVLYLQSESNDKYEAATEAADKLIHLLKKVTHEQKKALANLVKEWVLNNDVGAELILVLWEKYSRKSSKVSLEDSTAAAVLISMYASGKPEVIKSNIDLLTKYGLGVENQNNYLFLNRTCNMFHALFGLKNEKGVLMKYPQDSELFEKLIFIVQEQFTKLENGLYAEIAMEAITIIYRLSEYPDVTAANVIKTLYKKLSNGQAADSNETTCHEEILARFVIIIGHVAFCQWQYLENDVLNELKHRNAEAKDKENRNNKSVNKSKSRKNTSENTTVNDPFEDDTQALVNEQVAESVRMVCEKELLLGETLLAKMSRLIVQICQHTKKFNNTRVKSAASMALCKLMMVSSEFCSENIQLFVTLLERTSEPDVKINLILAFGDLTFRFPNIMDIWTGYFYNRLKDESPNVRYTGLIVISHLITNEMVKVRSQMSDVALCLVDSDKLIKNHALQLFYELSLKGNTLYNVMADIISRLSHPDHRPDEATFQIILKVLMKLITKDRHLESIVEKLCHRLRGATDERQCVDLSYCLTLISYSERSFQKLLDNIACYADKLNYAKVHKNFTSIIINCKKIKTSKIIDGVAELESKISIIITKGVENLDADFLKPPKTPGRVSKTPSQTPRNRNASMCKSPQTSARKLRGRSARKVVEFDSDDD